jgi:hypothetical protein
MIYLLAFCSLATPLPSTTVRYNIRPELTESNQEYYLDLLTLALEETKNDYGAYQLEAMVMDITQGRTFTLVEQQQYIDVIWTMTSIEREQRLLPIRIPLLKGLMGYRIFIIRKGEQAKFSAITQLEQLKSLYAGQGYDWPDSTILKHNGFNLLQAGSNSLLAMLRKKRFDYFPRALHEPWKETQGVDDVEIEQELLIKYPAPFYFFVNRNNSQLAKRIEEGLHRAIANGHFDKLFYQHEVTKGLLDKVAIAKRRVFSIENPLLSEESRAILNNQALWLLED